MANRRFGIANKFGATNQFGASSSNGRALTYALEIDWDNNHSFDGFNEATNRLMAWEDRRGREFVFNSSGDGLQPVDVGEAKFTLKNIDRRYDPYYVSGTLFEALQKNPLCRFGILDESSGIFYDEFTGYISDIRPKYGTVDTVEIVVRDGLQKLKDKNISSSSVATSAQYDDQIIAALSAASWIDGMNIDTTLSDSMSYHWFRGNPAFDEIHSLVEATFGIFFVDKSGLATYKSRISSDISVMSLDESEIDYSFGIQAPSPRNVVRNVIKVFARARKSQAGVELWRLVDKPSLAVGTGSPIWATYSYNGEDVPALSITEPVATTDYTMFQNVDGTGTDYTANLSWSRTGFATTSELTPTVVTTGGYLTLMKLRGTAITVDKYTYAEAQDSTSIGIYGARPLTVNSDWLQDLNTAEEQANLLLNRFSTLRFFPRVKIKRSLLAKQLTPELFDLVSINFASRQVTGELRVGYMEKSWEIAEPNVIDTIMYFEPNLSVSSSGAWVFPVTFSAQFG